MRCVPAIHALTGSDITSKVGTKAAALKADPVSYLKGFGKSPSDSNLDALYAKVEEYLGQVMKKGTHCKTMDELRYLVYHQSKGTSLDELPPPNKLFIGGGGGGGHVLRSFYSVFYAS